MVSPRSKQQRRQDVLERLECDVDVWVASADTSGTPYLVPLSFLWDGTDVFIATSVGNPTGRNLRDSGGVRLGFGLTRDVVLAEGVVAEVLNTADVSEEWGDAFAAKAGFDPRKAGDSYRYFRVRLDRVQAWREENELKDRELMRDGRWLTGGA
ncbi:pyridoxamine 5'-phosphate oxidase family protein [Spirillospora sp. NBC_01491]|uniref:pyridoxamine 5'-phosphate oxidase family protein n=1 Tax=Spirillospora sp. NBC_01491 TaxID=2976007 RepID=UPI002E2F8C7A|nr:pyridoxamine 5'-phosphate oxidase family protein [Spirillospora sp. NBC_01491]